MLPVKLVKKKKMAETVEDQQCWNERQHGQKGRGEKRCPKGASTLYFVMAAKR